MGRTKNRWLIAASAVGIHLSIGSVYAWSVFSRPIITRVGWVFKEVQLTFSIAILFLGLSAAFLGHFVEKYGPRESGILASLFFGLGIAGSGSAIETKNLLLLYFSYGVLGGIGLGRGVLLIRKMVDAVRYQRIADRNVLTLIMHKAPVPAE